MLVIVFGHNLFWCLLVLNWLGECVGDDYVTLQALWREKKHEPFRDHVADYGYDSKHKGCTNDKLGTYFFDYLGDCRSWWDEAGFTVDCEVWLGSLQYTDGEGNIHADFEKSACHGYQSGPGGPA